MSDDLQKYLLEPELPGGNENDPRLRAHRLLDRRLRETLGALSVRSDARLLSEKEFKARLLPALKKSPLTLDDARLFRSLTAEDRNRTLRRWVLEEVPLRYAAALLLAIGVAVPLYRSQNRDAGPESPAEPQVALLESDSFSSDAVAPAATAPRVGPEKSAPGGPQKKDAPSRPDRTALAGAAPAPAIPPRAEEKEPAASTAVALADEPAAAPADMVAMRGMPPVEEKKAAAEIETEGGALRQSLAVDPARAAREATEKRLLAAYKEAADPARKALARKALEDFYRKSGQPEKIKQLQ